MSDVQDQSSDEARELLTRRADVVRSRLLRRIDVLDHRRHELSRTVTHAASTLRTALPVLLSLTVVGLVVIAAARARRRKRFAFH